MRRDINLFEAHTTANPQIVAQENPRKSCCYYSCIQQEVQAGAHWIHAWWSLIRRLYTHVRDHRLVEVLQVAQLNIILYFFGCIAEGGQAAVLHESLCKEAWTRPKRFDSSDSHVNLKTYSQYDNKGNQSRPVPVDIGLKPR